MLKVLLWIVFVLSALGSFSDWISIANGMRLLSANHFGTGVSATVALAGLAVVAAIEDLRSKPANDGIPDEI